MALTARARILSAAARQHLHGGAHGLSMRGVADEVGVTATAIYRHFRDKDALLDAIVESGFASLLACLTQRSRTPRVLEVMDRFLDFALEQPRLYDLMFLRQREAVRVFPGDFAAHKSATFDLLRDAIEREMAAGALRRDQSLEVALTVWSAGHGLVSMYTLGRFGTDRTRFRQIFRRSMRRLYRGLALPPKKRSKK